MVTRILKGSYEQPYSDSAEITFHFQIIIQASKKNLRPSICSSCPEMISELIQNCWSKEIEQRKSTNEILEQLKEIEKQYNSKKSDWDALVK